MEEIMSWLGECISLALGLAIIWGLARFTHRFWRQDTLGDTCEGCPSSGMCNGCPGADKGTGTVCDNTSESVRQPDQAN